MGKRSRRKKKRFPREAPQELAPPTSLRHEVREKQPAHSADVVIGQEEVLEIDEQGKVHEVAEDNLQMDIIKRREWMATNQFSLTPQEREKKWDEIRALEGKLRSRA